MPPRCLTTTTQESIPMTDETNFIPLNKLVRSELNMRKTNTKAG
jgi:hypothetical protein